MAAHASGFGACNDVAIAIAWLPGHGAERIAYVDIDAHHGDGCKPRSGPDRRVQVDLPGGHRRCLRLFPDPGVRQIVT